VQDRDPQGDRVLLMSTDGYSRRVHGARWLLTLVRRTLNGTVARYGLHGRTRKILLGTRFQDLSGARRREHALRPYRLLAWTGFLPLAHGLNSAS
jgi:hypothetical protein